MPRISNSWLKVLKADSRAIFTAASKAQQATDWLIARAEADQCYGGCGMTTGRAIILNPTLPDSVKRRQCLLDSLRKSGLEYSEQIEETRIIITWQGQPKRARPAPLCRKPALPPPVTLEKCLKSRCICERTMRSTGTK